MELPAPFSRTMTKSQLEYDYVDGNIRRVIQFLATRGLLATLHVILNHGQVTWTTPELAHPSPNHHTTSKGRAELDKGSADVQDEKEHGDRMIKFTVSKL
ncbi:hypothetical protein TNCV_1883351 [Trichonephila clavipes]|nr:hypothetical protein TNCV_1883351 [Trichonephila clavipes]